MKGHSKCPDQIAQIHRLSSVFTLCISISLFVYPLRAFSFRNNTGLVKEDYLMVVLFSGIIFSISLKKNIYNLGTYLEHISKALLISTQYICIYIYISQYICIYIYVY